MMPARLPGGRLFRSTWETRNDLATVHGPPGDGVRLCCREGSAMNLEWIARVAASTVIRRLVGLVLVAVLAWAGVGNAHAACVQHTVDQASVVCASEGEAYAHVKTGSINAGYTRTDPFRSSPLNGPNNYNGTMIVGYLQCRMTSTAQPNVNPGTSICAGFGGKRAWWPNGVQCATPGDVWNATTKTCDPPGPTEEDCLNRNDTLPTNAVIGGTVSGACVDGCRVGPRPSGDHNLTTYESGAVTASIFSGAVGYTGETCSAPSQPPPDFTKKQECAMAADGQTMCVKPDGQHCYATGPNNVTQHCWRPGEVGTKTDGNKIQKREPGDKVANPTPPTPPDGDTLTQVGDPKKSTTTVNGTPVTTTTTNYQTGSGAEAGPPGGEPGDGSGEPDDGDDAGSAAGDVVLERMAGASDRTAGGIIAAYGTRIGNAPVVSAATGFFAVTAAGASCPTWTIPATEYSPAVVMDFWCVSELSAAWTTVGFVCLIVFGYAAFRIGVL